MNISCQYLMDNYSVHIRLFIVEAIISLIPQERQFIVDLMYIGKGPWVNPWFVVFNRPMPKRKNRRLK
jgi:hypothetical protein